MRAQELYSEILRHLREEEFYALLADFISYNRIQGTSEMKEAMVFVKEVFDANGVLNTLSVKQLVYGERTYGLPYFRGWKPRYQKATIRYGSKRIVLEFNLNPLTFVQRSGNIEGRYRISQGNFKNTGDSFILISDIRKGILEYLFQSRAEGVVLYDKSAPYNARKKFQFWYYSSKDPEFTGVVVTRREADEIKHHIEAKRDIFIEIKSSSDFYDPENLYLLARIEGEREDAILYVAHTCHARGEANDNGSGASSLIYAAITMQRMIDRGILKKPPYTVYFLLVPEMWGSALFVEEKRKLLNSIFAGFNFDMVGSGIEKTGGRVVIEKPHRIIKTNIHTVFKSHVESVQRFLDFPYAVYIRNFEGGSDHLIFQNTEFEIPMPMLIHWPDRFYHSDMDVISNIDPRAIWRNVILMVSMPYLIRKNKIVFRKRRVLRSGKDVYRVVRKGVYIPTMDEDFDTRIRWFKLLLEKKGYVNFMHFFYYIDGMSGFSDILSRLRKDSGKKVDVEIYREYVTYLLDKDVIKVKS